MASTMSSNNATNRAQAYLQGISENIGRRIRGIIVGNDKNDVKAAMELVKYYEELQDNLEKRLCLIHFIRGTLCSTVYNETKERE